MFEKKICLNYLLKLNATDYINKALHSFILYFHQIVQITAVINFFHFCFPQKSKISIVFERIPLIYSNSVLNI